MLGVLPIGLHAEHGFWSRMERGAPWTSLRPFDEAWKPDVRRILERATAATPGALVEEKTASIAWHWRMAEPELGASRAVEVARELEARPSVEPLEILRGDKVIEVRLRGVDKGQVATRVVASIGTRTLVCAMGDDSTDDDMFRALPPEAITIAIGFRPSRPLYRLERPKAARALLAGILAATP
jgi:trehalose 6-phosphate synthase/phosphatase